MSTRPHAVAAAASTVVPRAIRAVAVVCQKMPFWVFPASAMGQTNGKAGKVAKVGKILKKPPKSDTEWTTFDVTFPTDATSEQKALLAGTSILLDANFFEGDNSVRKRGYCGFRGYLLG
jgi:hypothetical protein